MAALKITYSIDGETREVACADTQLVLEALRDSGLPVRKSCRNGVCGLCKCRLVQGEITYHWREPYGLWQKHIDAGYILPCIAYPVSDVRLRDIPLEPEKSRK